MKNTALVFIKPDAAESVICVQFVEDFLKEHGVMVVDKVFKEGKQMKHFIDEHYLLLSAAALVKKPGKDYADKKNKMQEVFGEDFQTVVDQKRIFNAAKFMKKFKLDAATLNELWEAPSIKKAVLGPGIIVANITLPEQTAQFYVVTAFYPLFKAKYINKASRVVAFKVQFEEDQLSWKDFRFKVIGKTDPAKAVEGSLRNVLFNKWNELGLRNQPNYSDNGVHASAGPVEALRERIIWFHDHFANDSYVLELGKNKDAIKFLKSHLLSAEFFDETEDKNSSEVLKIISDSSAVK